MGDREALERHFAAGRAPRGHVMFTLENADRLAGDQVFLREKMQALTKALRYEERVICLAVLTCFLFRTFTVDDQQQLHRRRISLILTSAFVDTTDHLLTTSELLLNVSNPCEGSHHFKWEEVITSSLSKPLCSSNVVQLLHVHFQGAKGGIKGRTCLITV